MNQEERLKADLERRDSGPLIEPPVLVPRENLERIGNAEQFWLCALRFLDGLAYQIVAHFHVRQLADGNPLPGWLALTAFNFAVAGIDGGLIAVALLPGNMIEIIDFTIM